MAYTKVDQRFIKAFTKEFIAHLSKPYDVGKEENAAQAMLAQASPSDFGKISRIFDQLARLPCISRKEFHKRMAEAKSIEACMKPIIDKVAELILTPDKSRLNDKVIKAIGIDNYCRLVNGKNVSEEKDKIKIVANVEDSAGATDKEEAQKQFAKAEKNLAKAFLEAILPCYSASIYENNVLPEERTKKRLDAQMRALKRELEEREQIKGDFPTKWKKPELVPSDISLKEFDKQARRLIPQIAKALDEKQPTEKLWELLAQCDALRVRGEALLLDSNAELGSMTDPIQRLGFRLAQGSGSIFDLKEESRKLNYFELKDNIGALLKILELSDDLKLKNQGLIDAIQGLKRDLEEVQGELRTFEAEYAEVFTDGLTIPEHALAPALASYNKGISNFLKATDQTALNDLKPYEMGLIQRIINVISIGYFFAEERKCESNCINMKNELMKMKKESELHISDTADPEALAGNTV